MMKRCAVAGLAFVTLLHVATVANAQTIFFHTLADGRVLGATGGSVLCPYFSGVAGRSYSFEIVEPSVDTATILVDGPRADCPLADGSFITDTSNFDPPIFAGRRVSFVAPFDGTYVARATFSDLGPNTLSFSVSDTTMFSPAWSTFGGYETYYSILNTTNAACSGTLTLRSTAGSVLTSTPLNVPANATLSTNTVALGAPENNAGTATFTHTCPPGGFLAEAAIANFSITPTPYFQFVGFKATRAAEH